MPSRRSSSVSSRSHSRSRSRSHSTVHSSHSSRSNSRESKDRTRLHVSDIGWGLTKQDLEREFEKYGRLVEVWQSRTVPAFAFVVYRKESDAAKAVKATDGMYLHRSRIRVSFARPRAYERRRTNSMSVVRCYNCNRKGHFSRDCPDNNYERSRFSSRSARSPLTRRYRSDYRRSRSRSRSYRRSRRSHSRGDRRRSSRSSRDRGRRSRSKDRKEKSSKDGGSFKDRSKSAGGKNDSKGRDGSRSRSGTNDRRTRSKSGSADGPEVGGGGGGGRSSRSASYKSDRGKKRSAEDGPDGEDGSNAKARRLSNGRSRTKSTERGNGREGNEDVGED